MSNLRLSQNMEFPLAAILRGLRHIYNLKGSNHNNFALIGILICQNIGLDTKNIFLCLLRLYRKMAVILDFSHFGTFKILILCFLSIHTLRRFNKFFFWWSLYHEIWQIYDSHRLWGFCWRPFWKWPGIPLCNRNLAGNIFYVKKYHKSYLKKLDLEDRGGGCTYTYFTCPTSEHIWTYFVLRRYPCLGLISDKSSTSTLVRLAFLNSWENFPIETTKQAFALKNTNKSLWALGL